VATAMRLVFAIVLLILAVRVLSVLWILSVLIAPVLMVAGVVLLLRRSRSAPTTVIRSPEEELRVRYARGEMGRQQYQDAMVEILKDRYVRGIMDLREYERRVSRLFFGVDDP